MVILEWKHYQSLHQCADEICLTEKAERPVRIVRPLGLECAEIIFTHHQ